MLMPKIKKKKKLFQKVLIFIGAIEKVPKKSTLIKQEKWQKMCKNGMLTPTIKKKKTF